MTLPSKDECLTRLQEEKSTHDSEETCPICLDAQPNVLTSCQHRYCLECLSIWLGTSNTCPCCRGELYEADDDDLVDQDIDDEDLDDPDIDDEMLVLDSIDRLDLNFDVDEDEVTAAVISLRQQDLERSIARSSPIHVNYDALLARSVAAVLYLNPEVEEGFSLDDLDRSVWAYVLDMIQHTLSRLRGQTLTCGELWDALDKDIHVTFEGLATLRYADGPDGEHEFRHDLFDLLSYVTYQAHRCYSIHLHEVHLIHPLRQLPRRFTPLDHPFETLEDDIANHLGHIAQQDLRNINLHDLENRPLYLSFAQLYPAAIGAIYAIKPNVPPIYEDPYESRTNLRYHMWQFLLLKISDVLFDLHGKKLPAEQLWRKLDECHEYHELPYGGRRDGETTFGDDVGRVLRSIVLSAMRFNGVEPLPAGTVDLDMAYAGDSE